ncbi:hypothetical protein AB0L26_08570 [Streptomyces nondiastaticus]|uniref:hypothetical protein n=1 Tax=Streptomyces nondiastaticus TaxID=3154512 RepID=UPI0034239257
MTGDFNLDIRNRTDRQARESLHLRPDEQLARPNRSTRQRGGELDYAITCGTPRFNADIPAGRSSDHYPVQFEPAPTPVPAAPDGPVHNFSSAFENDRTGLVLDVDNSNRVTTGLQAYNARQRFRVDTVRGHWYRFRGNSPRAASGALAAGEACLGVNPFFPMSPILMLSCESPQAQWHPEDPGERAVLHDCTGRGSKTDGTGHRWQAEMHGDGTLRFRYEAAHLCLVPSARETGYATIGTCSDDARQRWTIVP